MMDSSELAGRGATCLTCVTRPPAPPQPLKLSDFSIDHILRHAGPRQPPPQLFEWLRCTRYRPPKLQRPKKEGCPRRKLGRNPRIPFTAAQVCVLEDRFRASPYLSAADVSHLSTLLRLSDTRIKIWFQNRRARERRDHGKDETLQSPPLRQHSGPIKSAFTPTPVLPERPTPPPPQPQYKHSVQYLPLLSDQRLSICTKTEFGLQVVK